MELRQLEYVVAVAEEASFTRAAERVHVAQSGVSAQVRRLERELGQELFDRTARGVRPTAAGAAVLPHARAALAAVQGVRHAVDELAGLVRGRLTVGTISSLGGPEADVADLLADFHAEHPAVEIALRTDAAEPLLAAVAAGRVDAAFTALPAAPPAGVATATIADEELVAVVAHGDPLARRDAIPLTALRERALVGMPRGSGLRSLLEDACAAAGFRPHVAFEAGDPRVVAQLAARGLGAAVVPASIAAARTDRLHALRVTRPPLRGRLALAWRADGPASPAAHAFVTRARAHFSA